ncbi:MAG: hypothetical protein ABL999_02295 [Pyrinomonadaceae bacterium]
MKKIKSIFVACAFVVAIAFIGGAVSANAQDTMMGKMGDKVQNTSKKVYNKGRRVGTTVGNKTWNGSKWVVSKSYRGGKWVAVKTVNGTKWVYRRGRNAVRGAKKPTP